MLCRFLLTACSGPKIYFPLSSRSKATRQRMVHSMTADVINRRFLKLRLTTQAGTYVQCRICHPDKGGLRLIAQPSLYGYRNATGTSRSLCTVT